MAATYPSTAWGQGGQNDFSEHAHYAPPVQDPSLTRNTSVFSSHPQATGVTYDELVEQSRRWEDTRPDPGMNILSNGSQNYHSSITQVTAGEESVKRREEAAQPQNIASGSRTSPGQPSIVDAQPKESDTTYLPPRTAASQEEHTSTPVPDTAHRKGEVVLNWSHPPEAVSLPQQAGPSGSQAESQPQNAPELLVLRERVQRLEAALVEREQSPGGRGDMPDRPPPAYESL
ncbi:hypothetical protein AN958_04262 [Leucoagaricus sp. SymC.cos]|nr:hypothetical protein AN958_04262 [Leucoagaricus sp. SymC.cos]